MKYGETEEKEAEETSKIGTVSKKVYFGYMKNGANIISGMILLLATICTQSLNTISDVWIAKWTNIDDAKLSIYRKHLQNCEYF